jgi:tRNA U55 pseudouridine synthase TruB
VLELLGYTGLTLRVRVECSKGTYIRTLVEQLGMQLGSCAHVIALRRDFVEPFRGETMRTLDELQADAPRSRCCPPTGPWHIAGDSTVRQPGTRPVFWAGDLGDGRR